MKRLHPIVYLTIAFVFGVLLAFKASGPFIVFSSLLLLLALVLLFKRALTVVATISFLLLGLAIGSYQNHLQINNPILKYSEKKVVVEGLVNSDVIKKNRMYSFKLAINKLNKKPVNIQIKGYTELPLIKFGNYVRLRGKVKIPDEAISNQPPMLFITGKPKVTGENNFWRAVGQLRSWIKESIISNHPVNQSAAFTYAMLTGQTSELSPITKNDLTISGLAHIWSVSGIHTGFLVFLIFMIFRLIGLRSGWQLIFISLSLAFFCAFTGLDPPVIRASIMAIWLSIAYLLGRKQNWLPSIASAALISLAIDPSALFQASFQLSYAAMISLLAFTPKIVNLLKDTPLKMKNALAAGLSAQILPLPLIAFYYGQIPLYSPIANLLAIPIAGFGFYFTIAALVLKTISLNIMWLPNLFSQLILLIGRFFATLPLSAVEVSPLIIIFSCFASLLIFVLIKTKKPVLKLSYLVIGFMALLAIGFWQPVATIIIKGPHLTVEFLDVGQGDSSLITGPNGERVLIDSGLKPYVIERHLLKRKIRNIDLVVASHADSDHIGGFAKIINNFKVKAVLYNGFPNNSYTNKAFLAAIKQKHISYLVAKRGQKLQVGKLKFTIIGPAKGFITGTESDDNNNSIIMRLVFGANSFLFTGDTGFSEEEKIWGMNLSAKVLKVSHHGSANGTSERFLRLVHPKVAVISAGKHNMYGHPKAIILRRLAKARAKIYRTDLTSDIKIEATTDELKVYE